MPTCRKYKLIEFTLLFWLVGAITLRQIIIVQPQVDIEFGYASVRLSHLNMLAIWLLLPTFSTISIKIMWTSNPSISCRNIFFTLMVMVYDLWTIYNIFVNWTVKLSVFVRPVQLFPAVALVMHTFFQINYISLERRLSLLNALFNVVMMIHAICMYCSFSSVSEVYRIFAIIELVYRLWAVCIFCDYNLRHRQLIGQEEGQEEQKDELIGQPGRSDYGELVIGMSTDYTYFTLTPSLYYTDYIHDVPVPATN